MQKPVALTAAAALAFGGLTFIGCQNGEYGTTMTGGGSTDTYGTTSYDRYRGGNIGTGAGPGGTMPDTPTAGTIDQTSGNLYGGKSTSGAPTTQPVPPDGGGTIGR